MYNTKRRGALDFTYQLKMTIEENNNLTKSVQELSKELYILRKDFDLINSKLKDYEEKDKKMKTFFKKHSISDLNELVNIVVKYRNNKCSCIPDYSEYKKIPKQLDVNEKKQVHGINNLNQELNSLNNKINIDKIKESIKQEYDSLIKNNTEENNKKVKKLQSEILELKDELNVEKKEKESILLTPSNSTDNKSFKKEKTEKNIENKINIIIDKIKKNNNLIKDEEDYLKLKNENRYKIDTLSFFYEKYGECNKNNNIKLLSISYDKNPSRFRKMVKIYSLIKNNKKLYNSNLLFQYHTFDDICIKDDLVLLINEMENKLLNCNNYIIDENN